MVTLQGETSKKIAVTIPAGIEDGKRIRLSGQGRVSAGGRQRGDLFITIHVQPHPRFRRQGLDVYSTAEINVVQALLGSSLLVSTVYGQKVELKIPAGTQNDRLFKLRGLGIKTERATGDFYVSVRVHIPAVTLEAAKQTLKKFAAQMGLDY